MPEGTEGQQGTPEDQAGAGKQPEQGQQSKGTQDQGQRPPWEREGQQFDPERAWSLIQNLQHERDSFKGKAGETAGELEQLRQKAMTDGERAVASAKAEGRSEASAEYGKRLAASSFATAAAKRNPEFDVDKIASLIDVGKFIDAKGEPDTTAIANAVASLVPAAGGAPSFDGGPRTTAPAGGDMNRMLRQAAGRE